MSGPCHFTRTLPHPQVNPVMSVSLSLSMCWCYYPEMLWDHFNGLLIYWVFVIIHKCYETISMALSMYWCLKCSETISMVRLHSKRWIDWLIGVQCTASCYELHASVPRPLAPGRRAGDRGLDAGLRQWWRGWGPGLPLVPGPPGPPGGAVRGRPATAVPLRPVLPASRAAQRFPWG